MTFIGGRVESLLGLPPQTWLDDPATWLDRVHPDDRAYVVENRARAARSGKATELEYRLIAADGRALWFRESVRVVDDADGRPRELRGLSVDISRRKKTERQLYHARKELADDLRDLRHLQTLTARLTSTLELDAVLREILESAVAIQGAHKGALLLYHPETDDLTIGACVGCSEAFARRVGRVQRGEGICGRVLATGEPLIVEDVLAESARDPYSPVYRDEGIRAVFSHPLHDREGAILGTLVSYFDAPHQPPDRQVALVARYADLASDAIANSRRFEALRESDQNKERALATLSHELRNPLAAVAAATASLRDSTAEPADRDEALDIIDRQVGQLTHLVGDLLDSVRVARGQVQLSPRPLDLPTAIHSAAATVRPTAASKGHTLSVEIAPNCPGVQADPARLEQILVNLLSNAIRYTESPGGRITFTAACEGDQVALRIRDNGVGFAPEDASRLFMPFSQVHPRAGASQSGLGLGLALVRELVERQGGRVVASSPGPGQGSEFAVYLPACDPILDPDADPHSRD